MDFKVIDLVVDCEFTDFIDMRLISMGLVGEGRALYLEVSDYDKRVSSGFVREVVEPLLGDRGVVSEIPFLGMLKENGVHLDDVSYFVGTKAECRVWLYSWLDSWSVDLFNVYANYSGDLDLFADLLVEEPVSVVGAIEDPTVVKVEGPDSAYDDFDVKGILTQNAFDKEFESDLSNYSVRGKNFEHHALVDAVVQYVGFKRKSRQSKGV